MAPFPYGYDTERLTPWEPDYAQKICFNPYLEGTFPNGTVSNCMRCHRTAVYKPKGTGECGSGGKNGAYKLSLLERCTDTEPKQGALPNCACQLPEECKTYFDGTLQTDFIWSIASAQDKATTLIQQTFVDLVQNPPPKK